MANHSSPIARGFIGLAVVAVIFVAVLGTLQWQANIQRPAEPPPQVLAPFSQSPTEIRLIGESDTIQIVADRPTQVQVMVYCKIECTAGETSAAATANMPVYMQQYLFVLDLGPQWIGEDPLIIRLSDANGAPLNEPTLSLRSMSSHTATVSIISTPGYPAHSN